MSAWHMGDIDWRQSIEPELMDYMNSWRQFKTSSWQELLRFIRNMYRHYGAVYSNMSPAMQRMLDPFPEGVFRYSF